MSNAGQFYTNRVLKEWKEKSQVHVAWVKAWIQALAALQAYVKEFHTTGLVWNREGGQALALASLDSSQLESVTAGSPAGRTAGGGPPPPPPPPPPVQLAAAAAPSPASARNDLMASLNQGEAITSGLRKVGEEEQTHKNPELRAGGGVVSPERPPRRTGGGRGTPNSELADQRKPPLVELQVCLSLGLMKNQTSKQNSRQPIQ